MCVHITNVSKWSMILSWLRLLEENQIIAVKTETESWCSFVLPAQSVFSDCDRLFLWNICKPITTAAASCRVRWIPRLSWPEESWLRTSVLTVWKDSTHRNIYSSPVDKAAARTRPNPVSLAVWWIALPHKQHPKLNRVTVLAELSSVCAANVQMCNHQRIYRERRSESLTWSWAWSYNEQTV